MVRMPRRTRVLARSVAPVKSSAMQPSSRLSPSPIRAEPDDGIGPKLEPREASQSLSCLFEEARIGRGLFKGGLVQKMNSGWTSKAGELELARLAREIGEPKLHAAA